MPQPPLGTVSIDMLLSKHRAWAAPPMTIEISGTSTTRDIRKPIRIVGTRSEEVAVDYDGTRKLVSTANAFFREENDKVVYQPTRSGFSQLDVTGVFFLAQLAHRPLTISAGQRTQLQSGIGTRIHVNNHRTEIHYARLKVSDEFDLYIGPDGLLAGLSRSFYQDAKPFDFTLSYAFSNYRDTNGVLLPYRIEKFLKGQSIEVIEVERYSIDVPAGSDLFQPTRGARVLPQDRSR